MLYSAPTTSRSTVASGDTRVRASGSRDRSPVLLINATDLTFRYRLRPAIAPTAPRAIDGVSLDIETGAIVGILGPNGSGKTTLIKILSGALTPASGAVTLDGRPLTTLPRRALATRVAMVPQETHLAFDYSAIEIVLMGRYPRLGAFEIEGPDDLRSAYEALAATGTRDLAARPFPTLSGGEKQRVIIASALAQLDDRGRSSSRALLFLDEPTASLDLRYQLELAELLRRLNAELGITMVLSTHDLRLAWSLCTHVILLARGRVLAQGPSKSVLTTRLVADLYGIDETLVAPMLQ